MGKIFCVEFQRVPMKFHTKYLTHTLKNTKFLCKIEILRALRFKSSYAFLKRPPDLGILAISILRNLAYNGCPVRATSIATSSDEVAWRCQKSLTKLQIFRPWVTSNIHLNTSDMFGHLSPKFGHLSPKFGHLSPIGRLTKQLYAVQGQTWATMTISVLWLPRKSFHPNRVYVITGERQKT